MKNKNLYIIIFFLINAISVNAQEIIVNHTCTDINKIPTEWINEAKENLKIGYGHTSHGSQLITGIKAFRGNEGDTFYFNYTDWGLNKGVFLNDYWGNAGGASDLGHNGDLSWRDATITMLNNPENDRNVVIWSWCGGVSDNSEEGINTYLNAMNQLEQLYPNITFVYMTGHLDGTGLEGNLHIRNEQIREYCKNNNKILFDFADIESYDPDGEINYNQLYATDGCEYDTNGDHNPWGDGNWATEWINANPSHQLTTISTSCNSCAHSEKLNCVLKGRAFWWLLARIAGWNGISQEEKALTIKTPQYHQILTSGEHYEIQWETKGTIDNVQLYYSTSNGDFWSPITSSIENTGSYIWSVPNTPSSSCILKIFEINGDTKTTSNTFAIKTNASNNNIYLPNSLDVSTIIGTNKDLTSNINTYLINTSNFPADCDFILKDKNGISISKKTIHIPANCKTFVDFSLFAGINGEYYQLEILPNIQIYSELIDTNIAFSAYLNETLNQKLFIPHIAEETSYWNSFIFISNQDRLETPVTVNTNTLTQHPFLSKTINVENLLPQQPIENSSWGTVEVNTYFTPPRTNNLTGFELFIKEDSDGAAVELPSSTTSTVYIPHIPVETNIFWTGFAFLNPTNNKQELYFKFYSATGELIDTETLEIDAKTKIKGILKNLFQEATGKASWGEIQCSGEGIVAVELYGTYNAGICGFALKNNPATEFTLPLMLAEDNQWTGIAITNPNEESSTVQISLINENGEAETQLTITIQGKNSYKAVVTDIFPSKDITNLYYIKVQSSLPIVGISAGGDTNFTYMNGLPMKEINQN